MPGEKDQEKKEIHHAEELPSPSQAMLKALVLGSISSSCCWIQLSLNLLSYIGIINCGCAGFNAFLGPIRPLTRSVTIAWLIWNWCSSYNDTSADIIMNTSKAKCCRRERSRPILSSLLCIFLMFSPEVLTMYDQNLKGGAFMDIFRQRNLDIDVETKVTRLNYVVDNMGCEACINAVEKLVTDFEAVVENNVVSLDTGEVEIFVDTTQWDDFDVDQKAFENSLNSALQTHGYELHQKGWVTKRMKSSRDMFTVGTEFL